MITYNKEYFLDNNVNIYLSQILEKINYYMFKRRNYSLYYKALSKKS